jgi:hypothetical protein
MPKGQGFVQLKMKVRLGLRRASNNHAASIDIPDNEKGSGSYPQQWISHRGCKPHPRDFHGNPHQSLPKIITAFVSPCYYVVFFLSKRHWGQTRYFMQTVP